MSGFYECVHRMLPGVAEHTQLSQELEMYKRATRLFGFDIAINDRTNLMPSKLHLVSNFQLSSLKFHFLFLILYLNFIFVSHVYFIHNFIVDTWWENYGGCVPILQMLAI